MDPYVGEIKALSYTFAPYGYASCDGQTLQIAQNSPLYLVIRSAYGGDGVKTFNLPDFRGRFPLGAQLPDSPIGHATGAEVMPTGTGYQSGTGLSASQMPPFVALNFVIALWGCFPEPVPV